MKKLRVILDLLRVSGPRWWMMLNPYSKEWDYTLNKLMDKYDCTYEGINEGRDEPFEVTLGDTHIWICNYPYSFGHVDGYGVRPGRLTILRLKRKIKYDKYRDTTGVGMLRKEALRKGWFDWFLIHWKRR